jgi:hypothetical protein
MKSRRVCHSAKLWHSLNKIKLQREGHLSCTAAQWRMLTLCSSLKKREMKNYIQLTAQGTGSHVWNQNH